MSKIRELAAAGRVEVSRSAQRDLENLGYDIDDVRDCLDQLELEECESIEESKWREGAVVCVFRGQLEEDDLYVKVCINPGNPGSLYLLSFKLYGSPR